MAVLDRAFGLLDRLHPPRRARAHCDIPCGIYDPHNAQIAALTVMRMVQLTEALAQPDASAGKSAQDTYAMQLSRYTAVKEEHAKICEHELVVLWTDYFKPEHLEKFPNLHDVFWKATKLTSSAKQQLNKDTAGQLLAACQEVAEIFWASKGVQTRRQPSNQTVGGEIVYPVAS